MERLKDFIRSILIFLLVQKGKRVFSKRGKKEYELSSEIDHVLQWEERFPFTSVTLTVRPIQVRNELTRFLQRIETLKPQLVCEIGTAQGGMFYLFTRVSRRNAKLISIDQPHGKFGGGYFLFKLPLFKRFKKEEQSLYFIRKDSHKIRTLEKLKTILKGRTLDLLFIDGDHSYEGVKQDFKMYAPLVRKGGVVAFHDIVPGKPEVVGGVPVLWNELKEFYSTEEIIEDRKQGGYGIGILRKD